MRATVSLLSCCESRPSMCGITYYDVKCNNFLQIPDYREALTASCSDLVDTVLALHSNSLSEHEAASLREAAERRAQFGRVPARSVSAPSRKRWFRSTKPGMGSRDGGGGGGSQEVVCDEFTKKLVAAITTWHDIHSSLLQLSYDRSSDSNDDGDEAANVGDDDTSSSRSWCSSDESDAGSAPPPPRNGEEDRRRRGGGGAAREVAEKGDSNHLAATSSRFSISNPDLTNCQIREMFPEMADHWRKALAKSPVVRRTAQDQETHGTLNKHRSSRYWVDEEIQSAEHIWLPSSAGSSASADSECYVGEKDCRRQGEKRRCAACHIVAHAACFSLLAKLNLGCKTTFRDYSAKKSPSKESTDALTSHHWVHKWRLEGRCSTCSKSFQQKMFFQGKEKKETIAVMCSWCKESYHLKNCFSSYKLEERCTRGHLKEMIVPPTWILRLANRKRSNHHRNRNNKPKKSSRQFIVKPHDMWLGPAQPLLVFVNPKSGGNKGSKALHTLCWLLNPRQVFDITALKGPKFGLEIFRKVVTQLRILVCGGDGTVGWVLSTLDSLNWPAYPPMAIMPLGTGNDLARCMGWGGVFSDEPLSQLLAAILHETTVTHLDRWRIDVEPNTSCNLDATDEDDGGMQSALPLTVMNNYFSIGADAHVALQFHHSRSANPQMLNSRLKNRIAYGGLGTIDLFKRSWKDLSDYITLECDGIDVTPRIKELKLHCILFHNITYYAGGTIPWGESADAKTSCCDGKVEVLGFTTATLAALQMGGKGERIAQCSRVRVTTNKAIPMQVDGEPCLLAPSVISLAFHSKVPMLKRDKKTPCTPNLMRRGTRIGQKDSLVQSTSLIIQLPVIVVGRTDYDTYKDCFERLKDTAYEIGIVNIESEAELNQARQLIQRLLVEHTSLPYEPDKNWRFLDYVSNAEEGTFRVSRQQEYVQSVSDVCNTDECLLLLDHAFPSITDREAVELFQNTNNTVVTQASTSSNSTTSHRYHSSRRISETLRIVLSSDAQETHL